MSNIKEGMRAWWNFLRCLRTKSSKIKLGPNDGAIVIRHNGEQELFIPPIPEEETRVTKDQPVSIITFFCWAHQQEDIMEKFVKYIEEDEDEDEEEAAS